jgi:alpha-ketoglutarate-dependent taurine dioxygenase
MLQQAVNEGEKSRAKFSTKPLGPIMGAEISGLDLSKSMSRATFAEIERLFNEHMLLCFRDQELTIEDQVAFTKLWGPLVEHTMANHVRAGANKEIQIASNAGADGKPNGKHPDETAMRWHTDRSWRSNPAMATILYGVEVPSVGGDTLFCNGALAYESLPTEEKRRVDSMTAIHWVEYSRRTGNGPLATEYEKRIGPPTPHPLARRHPATGRRAIYCGCHAWKIDGMSEEDGRKFLDDILAYATQDRFVYRHKWRRRDLVMWDNRCTMHAATPYDTAKELRIMRRTVVDGGPTV